MYYLALGLGACNLPKLTDKKNHFFMRHELLVVMVVLTNCTAKLSLKGVQRSLLHSEYYMCMS